MDSDSQRSTYLWLMRAGIKGVYNHVWPCSFTKVLCNRGLLVSVYPMAVCLIMEHCYFILVTTLEKDLGKTKMPLPLIIHIMPGSGGVHL